MKIKTLILATCIILTYHCKSQTTYVINGDTMTCLTEPQLDKVLGAYIDRDLCLEAYDTLAVGFDSCLSANEDLEQAVKLLKEDLRLSKVVSANLEAEKIAAEKQLKKEVRKRKLNSALVWVVSGISAAMMILYVVK